MTVFGYDLGRVDRKAKKLFEKPTLIELVALLLQVKRVYKETLKDHVNTMRVFGLMWIMEISHISMKKLSTYR